MITSLWLIFWIALSAVALLSTTGSLFSVALLLLRRYGK